MKMAEGRWVAYYRVSTARQGKSGLGLEAQQAAVAAHLNGGGWSLLGEFIEVESGKRDDRPQLRAALELCRLTGSTLVIAKLDRLSRDLHFLSGLMKAGVPFVACDNPHATKFTVHILAAVAEHEREMISARTKAALAASKARGKALGGYRGGPVPDFAAGAAAKRAQADEFAVALITTLHQMQLRGISMSAMARELEARKIRTAQGGVWTAKAVSRVLARMGSA